MLYSRNGSMRVVPGRRDDVIEILLRDVDALATVGCHLYVVSVDSAEPDLIWVYELWDSKEHHAASLELATTQEAIAAVMPMLTGDFTASETAAVGGLMGSGPG